MKKILLSLVIFYVFCYYRPAKAQQETQGTANATLLSVTVNAQNDSMTASWQSGAYSNMTGYRLYYATTGDLQQWALVADESVLTAGINSFSFRRSALSQALSEPVHHFQLRSVWGKGENDVSAGPPSNVYSTASLPGAPTLLIVDGFGRTSGGYPYATHSFAAVYANAMRGNAGVQVSTAKNDAVENGTIRLTDFDVVVWFTGDESETDTVLTPAEKHAIANYLQHGGKLFISGSEIAHNIGRGGAAHVDQNFFSNFLKAKYTDDGNANYSPASGITGGAFEGLSIPFGLTYAQPYPDNFEAFGGAENIFSYAVPGKNAGISFSGMFSGGSQPGMLVYIGFALETAAPEAIHNFTEKLLVYFGLPPLGVPPSANVDAAVVAQNGSKIIDVLKNDLANGTNFEHSRVHIFKKPRNGKATVLNDATILYEPNAEFVGRDTFQYRVSNAEGQQSSPTSVYLDILPASTCDGQRPEVNDQFPLRDLRGAWVSSVSNIDWPSSRTQTPAQQQAELLNILDTLRAVGINTVFLQVRPECDALYASSYDPWSYWLTNQQGKAPNPYWDPLQFAIDAAHERGMDLHAWLNPYRAKQSTPTLSDSNVAVLHPDWTFISGNLTMLDPGLPQVREYLIKVIADVATRYNVDGIHFDDYFYPFSGMGDQDKNTYSKYNPTNIPTIQDWRRNNVNQLIAMVYDTIQIINKQSGKNITFGVSPFGIWKSGVPEGISGTSSYSQLYCDPIAWLQNAKVDYLAPQLYWKITGAQDYDKLSQWWNNQGQLFGKQIFPGLALYKMVDANNWEANEILKQIALNRGESRQQIKGQVMFSARHIMQNSKNIKPALHQGPYRFPSEPPPIPGKDLICPRPVTELTIEGDILRWTAPEAAPDGDTAKRYVVFRYEPNDNPTTAGYNGTRVWNIGSKNSASILPDGPWRYGVASIDKNHNMSELALTPIPPIQLCPLGSTTVAAGILGGTYQWQEEVNGQWVNLAASANFSGTTTQTLSIMNLPVTVYGLQVRCLVDGSNAGPVYTIVFAARWTGEVSSSWSEPGNWSCGTVPSADVDVIIPKQVPNFPSISAPKAYARKITIHPNATLIVAADSQLILSNE